jgi:hypothetical protein
MFIRVNFFMSASRDSAVFFLPQALCLESYSSDCVAAVLCVSLFMEAYRTFYYNETYSSLCGIKYESSKENLLHGAGKLTNVNPTH